MQSDVSQYIKFFNEERPAYSLNYLTPMQFSEHYEQV
ncbi:MAG: IS3 family transposase [Clostridiales bacterium]|nr:IS3 family transposase [Clostridiales bacterium]